MIEGYCLANDDWEIQGNSVADIFSVLMITFSKCTGKSYCQNEQVIDNALDGDRLELTMIDSYFDFNDYESPVKRYLDRR